MNSSQSEPAQQRVFEQYIEAFSRKDFEAVASHFSVPALLVATGAPIAIDSREKLVGMMRAIRDSLPAEYDHTLLTAFELTQFSEQTAAAHITYNRCSNLGAILSKEQGVYFFSEEGEQWLIYSAVLMTSQK